MKFLIFPPLLKALLSASRYQRCGTMKAISYFVIKKYNFLMNKKNLLPKRYICSTALTKDKLDDSAPDMNVNENCSEMATYFVKNLKTGDIVEVKGKIGESLMEETANYIPDVHGACGGSRACTTCHMYMDEELEDILPQPSDEEQDMLDKAAFLKPNSRLSCQVIITKDFQGKLFATPIGTVNMQVDAQVSKKH